MICNPVIAGGGSKPEWASGRAEVTISGKFGKGIFTIPRKSTAICRAIAQGDTAPALIIRADNIEQYSKSGSATLDRISFSDTEITLKYEAMYPGSYVEYEYVVF